MPVELLGTLNLLGLLRISESRILHELNSWIRLSVGDLFDELISIIVGAFFWVEEVNNARVKTGFIKVNMRCPNEDEDSHQSVK